MAQRNLDVRNKAKEEGIKLWEIGDKMGGISDANFSRLLRKELDENTKKLIFSIIQELKDAGLEQATTL